MENRIQPILCCVGADVAGQPTQFLMERAAAAAHLDWHVITVEVSSEQLVKAWQGMDVMGFQAIRFFPTHQVAAMSLVAEPTAEDMFVGGVTSAMRVGVQWTMWHNSGPALLELLNSRVAWKDAVLWLHGDGANIRSLLISCKDNPPRHILWTGTSWRLPTATPVNASISQSSDGTDGSTGTEHVALVSGETSSSSTARQILDESGSIPASETAAQILPTHLASALSIEIIPQSRDSELIELLTTQLANTGRSAALVYVGPDNPRHIDAMTASQPTQECALTIVSSAPGSRRKLNDLWRAGPVTVLAAADVIVAEEAYDQTRWTGIAANIELLREAYEEYADF